MNFINKIVLICGIFTVCTNAADSNSSAPQDIIAGCGSFEVYQTCGSSCGDLTCENPSYAAMLCTDNCVRGCYCIAGYVRDSNKRCIRLDECPAKCPINEHLSNCEKQCESSCENPDFGLYCKPSCQKEYVCVCDSGFVRKSDGSCVRKENCGNSQCPKNEHFTDCGSACPGTCTEPFYSGPCIMMCVPGCYCNDGFVRSKQDICVSIDKCCSDDCNANEVFKLCGSVCQPTCDNPEPVPCRAKCEPGCFCKKGFVRNSRQECVPLSQCPGAC